jgi:hypothetical protein
MSLGLSEIPATQPKFPALRKPIPWSLDQGIVAEVAVMSALLPLKPGPEPHFLKIPC